MARTARSTVADRIRIEDEVWEEAFASRVPSRPPRTGRPRHSVRIEARPRARRALPPLAEAPPRTRPALPPFAEGPARARPAPSRPAVREAAEPYSGMVGLRPGADRADSDQRQPGAGRRTVRIQGRGAERHLPVSSSRPRSRRARESVYSRPDKLAMWAVLLGFLLAAAAILSAHI